MSELKDGPLTGLRVIEIGQLLAGPFCGQLLADLGAEVLKLEPPGQGDPLREWGQVRPKGVSVWFAIVGRNKHFATLDLRQEEGRALFRTLAAKSDVIVENFRPGTLEKWGLGWVGLHALNPRLILTRVSGYGQTGPFAAKAGYASVGEAFAGMRYLIGEPDRLPSRTGTSIGDSLAATFAALGTLAALQARHATGRGQIVDAAIYESCLAMMESLIPDYQHGGLVRERTGSFLPKIAPSNIYRTADGMVIIGANQDSVFARLCAAMGRPELSQDERFSSHIARGQNQAALDAIVSSWTGKLTSAQVQAQCDANAVPCGPVNRAPDLLADAHVAAREAIVSAHDPEIGEIKMQAVFPKLSETPGGVRWPAKRLGADNDYVWREIAGVGEDRMAALKAAGVI
jgi:crotonobetainyl-CoA:carnitine CoA-transferase CaiB-like acyl-CoA transferase